MKKTMFLLVILSTIISAQTFTTSGYYQLNKSSEWYGVSLSKSVKSWNHNKVTLKAITSFAIGNHWGGESNVNKDYKFEIGVESKNYVIQDRDFFTTLNLSYVFNNKEEVNGINSNIIRENGVMFSAGFGANVTAGISLTARYVISTNNGIRLSVDYGF